MQSRNIKGGERNRDRFKSCHTLFGVKLLFERIREDVKAVMDRDPAARNFWEIFFLHIWIFMSSFWLCCVRFVELLSIAVLYCWILLLIIFRISVENVVTSAAV